MSKKHRRQRKRTKPTGTLGPIVIDVRAKTAEFVPIQFPAEKPEVERYILDCAIATVAKTGHSLYHLIAAPVQNRESDFDFSLPTANGEQFLDLLELAPLTGPYRGAPTSYVVGDFATELLEQVMRKAGKYGQNRRERIHLLTYNTDWRFRPDRSVLSLLTLWLVRRTLPFATIFYYSPEDQASGDIWRLFPSRPEELQNIDEGTLRQGTVQLADFTQKQVDANTGAVTVPLGPSPLGTLPTSGGGPSN